MNRDSKTLQSVAPKVDGISLMFVLSLCGIGDLNSLFTKSHTCCRFKYKSKWVFKEDLLSIAREGWFGLFLMRLKVFDLFLLQNDYNVFFLDKLQNIAL